MKNYVGRKIKGFRYKDNTDGLKWIEEMTGCIGEIGEIKYQHSKFVGVFINNYYWQYPISLVDEHLVEETPEIPQLGEGVLMEVSDNGVDWFPRKVVGQLPNGDFVTAIVTWKKARPIQQLPKYTHAELVEKLGHDFEYGGKDE
jgi:hypothetical protein